MLRVETDVDHGSPYEAHVRKSDGTEVEVLVDSSFTVTAANTMQHPYPPAPGSGRRCGRALEGAGVGLSPGCRTRGRPRLRAPGG